MYNLKKDKISLYKEDLEKALNENTQKRLEDKIKQIYQMFPREYEQFYGKPMLNEQKDISDDEELESECQSNEDDMDYVPDD